MSLAQCPGHEPGWRGGQRPTAGMGLISVGLWTKAHLVANESPSTQDPSWASDLQAPELEPPELLTWLSVEPSATLSGFTSQP